jgi:hypothetical protein
MISKISELTEKQLEAKGKHRRIVALVGDAERAIRHRDYKSVREYCYKIIELDPCYFSVYPLLSRIHKKEGRLEMIESNVGKMGPRFNFFA